MSVRLAVATEDFGTNLKHSIGRAARAQVDGVRLNSRTEILKQNISATGMRQLRHYVSERQMELAGLYCPTRHAIYDADHLEARLQAIRQSMQAAVSLKTNQLLVRVGRIPDATSESPAESPSGPTNSNVDSLANPFAFASGSPAATGSISPAKQYRDLVEILNDLTAHGNHVGCTLNLILSGFQTQRIVQLIRDVSGGPLQIAFDPATAVMTGTDVCPAFRDLYRHCGYVRGRDAMCDVDGAGVEVAVGEGAVPWTEFLPTLVEADYDGWICVERSGGESRESDVLEGVARLKKLLPQVPG